MPARAVYFTLLVNRNHKGIEVPCIVSSTEKFFFRYVTINRCAVPLVVDRAAKEVYANPGIVSTASSRNKAICFRF
jgi:hypothetical protein